MDIDSLIKSITDDIASGQIGEFVVPLDPSIQTLGPNSMLNMYDQKYNVLKDLKTFNVQKAKEINYKTNNCGHRSENFQNRNKSITNVLFAGCSVTFGEALPDEQYWPYYVKQSLLDLNYNLGPMQILSYMGGSIDTIIDNVFKYIQTYDKPDYIFMLLPDITRDKKYNIDLKSFQIILEDQNINEFKISELKNYLIDAFYSYHSKYLLLEILCNKLGIKLISTSWKSEVVEAMHKLHPQTFAPFTMNMSQEFIDSGRGDNFLKNVNKEFILESADGLHPGILHNIFYGDIIFQYAKKNDMV